MMTFGAGWAGLIWMLTGLALVAGVTLVIVWAVQRAGGGSADALVALRGRLARGDIDAAQFEEMRGILGSADGPDRRDEVGLIGLLLIIAAVVAWGLGGATGPSGWDRGSNGMMGPGGMMGPAGIGDPSSPPREDGQAKR